MVTKNDALAIFLHLKFWSHWNVFWIIFVAFFNVFRGRYSTAINGRSTQINGLSTTKNLPSTVVPRFVYGWNDVMWFKSLTIAFLVPSFGGWTRPEAQNVNKAENSRWLAENSRSRKTIKIIVQEDLGIYIYIYISKLSIESCAQLFFLVERTWKNNSCHSNSCGCSEGRFWLLCLSVQRLWWFIPAWFISNDERL